LLDFTKSLSIQKVTTPIKLSSLEMNKLGWTYFGHQYRLLNKISENSNSVVFDFCIIMIIWTFFIRWPFW